MLLNEKKWNLEYKIQKEGNEMKEKTYFLLNLFFVSKEVDGPWGLYTQCGLSNKNISYTHIYTILSQLVQMGLDF